jgi:hypothetical protein
VTAVASLPSFKCRRVKDGRTTDGQLNVQGEKNKVTSEPFEACSEKKESTDEEAADRALVEPAAGGTAAAAQRSQPAVLSQSDAPLSHVLAPIARCDSDSLSIVLSMLSTDDFLSAIRVSKQFYATRLKKSAWPTLQLESFIQRLRDNDHGFSARRLHLPISFDPSVAEHEHLFALGSAAWLFVSNVQLYGSIRVGNAWLSEPPVDLLLPELARMPCLTAVNFHRVSMSSAAFGQFCTVVAPRLLVLLFEHWSVDDAIDPLTHIGLLRELRVLVVDRCPPASSLLQLHLLVRLHVNEPISRAAHAWEKLVAVRRLSSSHALRSLSFGDAGMFSTTGVRS